MYSNSVGDRRNRLCYLTNIFNSSSETKVSRQLCQEVAGDLVSVSVSVSSVSTWKFQPRNGYRTRDEVDCKRQRLLADSIFLCIHCFCILRRLRRFFCGVPEATSRSVRWPRQLASLPFLHSQALWHSFPPLWSRFICSACLTCSKLPQSWLPASTVSYVRRHFKMCRCEQVPLILDTTPDEMLWCGWWHAMCMPKYDV